MKMFVGVSALCLAAYTIAGLVSAEVVKNCTDNSQCEPGQCCQKLKRYMMMSKRDVQDHDITLPGTCANYTRTGDPCDLFDKANGYCSCKPGSKCSEIEKSKRSPRMVMGNTIYKCLETRLN